MRKIRFLTSASALLLALAACGSGTAPGATAAAPGEPMETRDANGAPFGQEPAFEGQTRAPYATENVDFDVTVLTEGLELSWAMEILPDGRMLVTERGGAMRLVTPQGAISDPIEGLPPIEVNGQGGLLDVALHPGFADNQLIYWSFAEARGDETNGTSLARGRLVTDGGAARVEGAQVIFQQQPAFRSGAHFGSRIAFAPDGTLFLTTGERALTTTRGFSQDVNTHLGKVIHLNDDGSVPANNPFVGRSDARPEIWSYGHRNMQGAAINPATGALWTLEHGPMGGDELNVPEAGKNYGWPVVTYGIDYGGQPEGEGITQAEGVEQPKYYWDPVIAPSGMLFYTGDMFPEWRGNMFTGGLSSTKLVRLQLDGERVTGEEWLLADRGWRVRDVRQDADGSIVLLTEQGAIARLSRAE